MNKLISRALLPALALAFAGFAHAGNGTPNPAYLPECLPIAADGPCRLPVKNGSFGVGELSSWTLGGDPTVGSDNGNPYALLSYGRGISQVVYAGPLRASENDTYVLQFRYRTTVPSVRVRAELSLVDHDGRKSELLGSMVAGGEPGVWQVGELVVSGKTAPYPRAVHVEILNYSFAQDGLLDIDDVYLLDSPDAEAVSVTR